MRAEDAEALFAALPHGEAAALTAAEVADVAGVNRRSAGTKLAAMGRVEFVRRGMRHRFSAARRQSVYWREAADQC